MKKWVVLLLVISLISTASAVMAQENQDEFSEDISGFDAEQDYQAKMVPDVPYGSDIDQAVNQIREEFTTGYINISGMPQKNIITMPDGKQYQEVTISGSGTSGVDDNDFQMEAKYYGTAAGKIIAGVLDFTAPEGIDINMIRARMLESYGEPEQLVLDNMGEYADLLREPGHLEDGTEVWNYTTRVTQPGPDGQDIYDVPVRSYMALQIIDDHAYLTQFPDIVSLSQMSGKTSGNLDIKGFDQLTQNDQYAVSAYADYLEKQKTEQLEQYVDYLLNKHEQ